MAGVVARRLDRRGDERMVSLGRLEVPLEQRPHATGMALGEREEREVAAAQGRAGVGDDRAQSRHSPTRPDQRRRRGVLPALQLGDAKGDDVGIQERAAALQHRQQTAVHLRQRRLERFGAGATGERQRLPAELAQLQRLPRRVERIGVARAEQPLQSRGESAEAPDRVHMTQ